MRTPKSKWDWHDSVVKRENHPAFLPAGEGLKQMARPVSAKASRQNLEKQIAKLQAQLTVAKTDERHINENKQKRAIVK